MALIVEDGTGLATAEAYVSVVDAETYIASIYGTSEANWEAATTADKEQALRRAARYLDGHYAFVGVRKETTQALEWPRSFASAKTGNFENFDLSGFGGFVGGQLIEGVPVKIEEASAEVALLVINNVSLFPISSEGGNVTKVRVGPIEQTFSEKNQNRQPIFHMIDALVRFIIEDTQHLVRS